jgi:hypothetical protein
LRDILFQLLSVLETKHSSQPQSAAGVWVSGWAQDPDEPDQQSRAPLSLPWLELSLIPVDSAPN